MDDYRELLADIESYQSSATAAARRAASQFILYCAIHDVPGLRWGLPLRTGGIIFEFGQTDAKVEINAGGGICVCLSGPNGHDEFTLPISIKGRV